MGTILQDLKYGLRMLAKNPGFTAVAVLTLALGIGANTAIFTLVNALLLRDLPVRQPERLVELSAVRRNDKMPFSFPMFREIERGQRVFSGLVGWGGGGIANIEVNGVLSQADVLTVTGNYYSELGVTPVLGRLITPEDIDPGRDSTSRVAVLGYEFWQRRFGSGSDVVGKQISIDGKSFTIIGVTRKWFTGMKTGESPEITIPLTAGVTVPKLEDRSHLWVYVTGRLKDGVSIDQARAQLKSFWPEVLLATAATETPGLRRQTFLSMGLDVAPVATGVNSHLRSQFTRPLYVLVGIVGLILLVACVSLSNLMLARAAARRHEMSLRMALGASRWALAREVLTESLALSICGGLLGLAFAFWGTGLIVTLMTQGYFTPVILDLRPDLRVLSLTAFVAIVTGIFFGLAPAWQCSRQDPASMLQQNTRTLAGATGKLGKALTITQVALSLVLVLAAGLLVRSFQKLCSVDLGFERESVLDIRLYPRPGGYQNLGVNSYHRQLIERISSLPGVRSVGLSRGVEFSRGGWQDTVSPLSTASNPSTGLLTNVVMVSPGFFRTLGIDLLRGRDFSWGDDERHLRVAIVSSSLVQRLFPSGNPIGQHVRFGMMPGFQDLDIVGVAGNARIFDLRDAEVPVLYLSGLQFSEYTQFGRLFVRTHQAPEALARSVGHEIESLGHEYPLSTKTVAQEVSQALVEERVIAILSGLFATLALLIASVALYGLMSYAVTSRTREMGIRAALGAQRADLVGMVLRESLFLVLAGIAIGIPAALAAARLAGSLISGLLFGLKATDPTTIFVAAALMVAVALFAGYLPARRASRVDPMVALRYE